MFEVIKAFRDSKNNGHLYEVGDTYPIPGHKPTKARVEELVKGKNKFGVAFLKEIADPKKADNKISDGEDVNSLQTLNNELEE